MNASAPVPCLLEVVLLEVVVRGGGDRRLQDRGYRTGVTGQGLWGSIRGVRVCWEVRTLTKGFRMCGGV